MDAENLEETQIEYMPYNCVGCGWENEENCRACRMESKLKEILAVEAQRIER